MRIIPLAAMLLLAMTGGALAQAVGIPRNEQEPSPGAVQQGEQALGLAPSAQQNQQQQQSVDQLYQELTGQNPNAMPRLPNPPMLGTPRQDAREEDRLYRELTGQNPAAPPSGPLPPQGPPMSSQAGAVNQMYQGMTGQSPTGAAPAAPVPTGQR